ncbi:MAG: hypothetical protein IPN01_17245 [Deltaproteobacteria bacterium]|nr:hypothetical protein [Deltaproteobacteria bacterium]
MRPTLVRWLPLQERYAGQTSLLYADPPYNTQDAGFPYKNGYKHSTWAAMVNQILPIGRTCCEQGVTSWAIDDTEPGLLRSMLDEAFGIVNFAGTVAVEVNPAGQNIRDNVPARSHDYFHIYANSIENSEMQLRTLTADEEKQYKLSSDDGAFIWDNLRRRGGNSRPSDRPKQYFPLYASLTPPRVELSPFPGSTEIFPIDPKGEQRIWRNNRDGVVRDLASGRISVISKAGRMEVVKKSFMPEGKKWKTIWTDSRYSATSHGTKLLLDMILAPRFPYPKSLPSCLTA